MKEQKEIRKNPRCVHLCYPRSKKIHDPKKTKSSKEAKSFPLAPMGAASRFLERDRADSGNMA